MMDRFTGYDPDTGIHYLLSVHADGARVLSTSTTGPVRLVPEAVAR